MTGQRLLIIDDEADFGAAIKRVAAALDFEVAVTTNAEEFKQLYESFRPDAIALDLCIPENDGIELLRFLADNRCQAQIVIISGFDQRVLESAERLGNAFGLRMAGVIAKPISLSALRALLNSFGQAGERTLAQA